MNPEAVGFHHLVRAADAQGNNGHFGLGGRPESAGFEGAYLFAPAAGAFGEDEHAVPFFQKSGGFAQGFHRLAGIAPVHKDAVEQFHPAADERHFFQLFFGQNAAGPGQIAQHQGDVKIALVVAHIDHGPLGNVLKAGDLHLDAGCFQKPTGPFPHGLFHNGVAFLDASLGGELFAPVELGKHSHQIGPEIDKPKDRSHKIPPQDVFVTLYIVL